MRPLLRPLKRTLASSGFGAVFSGLRGITIKPEIGSPTVTQRHALTLQGFSVTPQLGVLTADTRSFYQAELHGISATPELGVLTADQTIVAQLQGISVTPQLGSPTVIERGTQVVALQGISVTPEIGEITEVTQEAFYQVSGQGLTITPQIGAPTVTQRHQLTLEGISVTPTLGSPTVTENTPSSGWTPSDDSSIIHWWDADDAGTISSSGGLVSGWDDKAGNQHWTQTAGDQPSTGTRTLNGKNVIDFDGTKSLEADWDFPVSGSFSVFAVFESDITTNNNDAIFARTQNSRFEVIASGTPEFQGAIRVFGAGNTSTGWTGGPYTGTHILEVVMDFTGAVHNTYIDGVAVYTGANYVTAVESGAQSMYMMRRSAVTHDGFIAEMILTEAIDSATRDEYRSYLADKWGITLP